MSEYEELQQFVATVSADTENCAWFLEACRNKIAQNAAWFSNLTNSTQDGSARTVMIAFLEAQKQLAVAEEALRVAAETGYDWSGASGPVHRLVLKPGGR